MALLELKSHKKKKWENNINVTKLISKLEKLSVNLVYP